jgi:hypothetical protein
VFLNRKEGNRWRDRNCGMIKPGKTRFPASGADDPIYIISADPNTCSVKK